MEDLVLFFENISSVQRTLILATGITFFWILEGIIPIRRFQINKWKHSLPNFVFTLTTLIINLFFAFLIVKVSDWTQVNRIGFTHTFSTLWIKLIAGIMIMDFFGAWLIHWIEHKIYFLWKFHIIHHTDLHVDTTTALRHHPGESVFRASFTILAVVMAGAPIWMIMIYQSLSALFSQFNHANIRLPHFLDKGLSYVFVTPGMHRIHHHFQQPLTDRNYGNIFSIWDHMTGNYIWVDQKDLTFGVDVFHKDSQNIKELLAVPFDGERYTHDK